MLRIDKNAVLLALMFAVPIAMALRPEIYNPDIWCHLRTGDWILQKHTFPQTDPFAQGGAQRPFLAYSWLFEVTAAKLYSTFGLFFLPAEAAVLTAAIVLALFLLLRSFRLRLSSAVLLILCAALSIHSLFYLRTWLFSILFFVLELWLLFRPDSNPKRVLIVLPIIFMIWANVHIQFTYGLFILALFVAEGLFLRFTKSQLNAAPAQWTLSDKALLLLLCVLATLVNPYGYRIYQVFLEYATQTEILPYVREQRPFTASGLALLWLIIPAAAIWWIGYYRERRPFVLALLAWALFSAFHMVRDAWVLVVVIAFIVATTNTGLAKANDRIPLRSLFGASALVLILVLGIWRIRHIDRRHLAASVRRSFPSDAADYIEANQLRGPLFNEYGWGGYLMWRLPFLPVSIDGRTNLYGPERIAQQRRTVDAAPDWAKDPTLRAARLILIHRDDALASVLRVHPCYRLAYSDSVSNLFTPRDECSHGDSLASPVDRR